ncbi:MAG: hypothetical protein ONB51_01120 [candidate division KSB1 bacterium]|nr:hypothetical protein [candidate division KSB1 bacterium]MDZ7407822.1 hypothetical protein [candidate division KSB1 bacterium]
MTAKLFGTQIFADECRCKTAAVISVHLRPKMSRKLQSWHGQAMAEQTGNWKKSRPRSFLNRQAAKETKQCPAGSWFKFSAKILLW